MKSEFPSGWYRISQAREIRGLPTEVRLLGRRLIVSRNPDGVFTVREGEQLWPTQVQLGQVFAFFGKGPVWTLPQFSTLYHENCRGYWHYCQINTKLRTIMENNFDLKHFGPVHKAKVTFLDAQFEDTSATLIVAQDTGFRTFTKTRIMGPGIVLFTTGRSEDRIDDFAVMGAYTPVNEKTMDCAIYVFMRKRKRTLDLVVPKVLDWIVYRKIREDQVYWESCPDGRSTGEGDELLVRWRDWYLQFDPASH